MSVYNKSELEKLSIITEAKSAYVNNLISKDEIATIETEYRSKLYISQITIRIGLFLAVVILSAVVFGLFTLMFLDAFNGFGFISIFLCFVTTIITYYLSARKMHFGSGADNAFLYCSIIFFMVWVGATFHSSSGVGSSLILFVISTVAALIFLDKLLTIVSLLALLSSFYFGLHKFISLDFLMPCIMFLSFLIAWASNKFINEVGYWERKLLKVLMYSSLTTAFLATNSFFISGIINERFIFKIIFDILTFFIPVIYILIGIKFKNLIVLRCGGILFLAAVYSLIVMYSGNYFFEFLSLFAALILAVSWWLSRYLEKERAGFIFIDKSGFSNIEALGAINTATPPAEGFKFGGGSFGGGGASGEF